jgi:Zn-dependent protease
MQAVNTIFYIAILVMSVVIHEISHGFMAERFGDKTARHAGRLTLNPLNHLDLFGSIILPAFLYLTSGFVFGWAKPVPYNPDNLSNKRWGTMWVALAGVLANLLVALIFALFIRIVPSLGIEVNESFYFVTSSIVLVNLGLMIFNLVPIPPLDGSKVLFSLLPPSFYGFVSFIEQYSLPFLIAFIVFFSDILSPILFSLFKALTGIGQ